MSTQKQDFGRIMAIDLGEKRIGIALSDPTRLLASSHTVLERTSRRDDFARYQAIIEEYGVTLVLMGLPLSLDGSDSAMTSWVRDYSAECATVISTPLQLWDETFTTRQAHNSMKARGTTHYKKRKERIDAVAAAFLLQDYLDAHALPST